MRPETSLRRTDSQLTTGPWTERLPEYISRAILEYGYDLRDYQAESAIKASRHLKNGSNVEICLPPGTGKTLIGQIVACMWLRRRTAVRSKVLCVLPNTNLLHQHFEYSNWAYQSALCRPLLIHERWRSDRKIDHRADLNQTNIWFTLPLTFSNAVNNDDVPPDALKDIDFVIFDEYDAFSRAILSDEPNAVLSFKRDMQALRKALQHGQRNYLFMSATPARQPGSRRADRTSAETVWTRHYRPTVIHIERRHYQQFLPVAHVTPVGVEDLEVFREDRDIAEGIGKAFGEISTYIWRHTGSRIGLPYLIARVDNIIRTRHLTLPTKRRLRMDHHSIQACIHINQLKYYRLKVFEDVQRDANPFQQRSPASREPPFTKSSKFQALIALIRRERRQKNQVVVFLRYVEPLERIAEVLRRQGLSAGCVSGQLDPTVRSRIIASFKAQEIEVLLASRELFGRGFDLPEAGSAIFYSPKDNVCNVWQEFLRIRGTQLSTKRIYVLFYMWTAESSKMLRLLTRMWSHGADPEPSRPHEYVWSFEENEREGEEPTFHYYDFNVGGHSPFHIRFEDERREERATGRRREKTRQAYSSRPSTEAPRRAATSEHEAASNFIRLFSEPFKKPPSVWSTQPREWLEETTAKAGLREFYSLDLLGKLVSRFATALTSTAWKRTKSLRRRKNAILLHIHPDHQGRLDETATRLFNDVTGLVIQML